MLSLWTENQTLRGSLLQSQRYIAELEVEATCLRAQLATLSNVRVVAQNAASSIVAVGSHSDDDAVDDHVRGGAEDDSLSVGVSAAQPESVQVDPNLNVFSQVAVNSSTGQPHCNRQPWVTGRLSCRERTRMDLFIHLVRTHRLVVRRGDLARDMQQFVNPERTRQCFEKLVSRQGLNNSLGSVLGPRDKRKRTQASPHS